MSPRKPVNKNEIQAEGSSAAPVVGTVVLHDRDRTLTADEFRHLADVPPGVEWFANLTNPRTRRAYRVDIEDFSEFAGIRRPEEFRLVVRAHVIAWRKALEQRNLSPTTIRRKLSALSAIFNHLCESNAVLFNPTHGVKRPAADANEGRTPAISDGQARALLEAPPADTLKGKRDRAVLSTFLFHGLRCEGLCLPWPRRSRLLHPFAAGNGRNQRPGSRGGYRQGAGVARARRPLDHAPVRSTEEQARGQPDVWSPRHTTSTGHFGRASRKAWP